MDYIPAANFDQCVFAEDDGIPTAENTYSIINKKLGLVNDSSVYAADAYFKVPADLQPGVTYTIYPKFIHLYGNGDWGSYTFTLDDLGGAEYISLPIIPISYLSIDIINFLKIYANITSNGNLICEVPASGANAVTGLIEAPTISNFIASAETDGHDIYHNVTATITETSYAEDGSLVSIDKVLTFKLKNNKEIVSATLNGSEIILVKA